MVEAPGSTCQMNCTSRGCQIQFFDKSVFDPNVLQFCCSILLDGCGCESQTHNVESENTWTFILVNFAAGYHRNVFQSCRNWALYASFRSINIFHSSLHRLYQILCAWSALVHRHSFEIFVILCKPRWSPNAGARELAPDRNVEQDSLEIGRIISKSGTKTDQYLTVKFVLLLVLRLEIICGIVELLDVLVSISIRTKINFLTTWQIFCRNRSARVWCSWSFQLSESCWHKFSRLESPPAPCSGGSTAWESMSALLSLRVLAIGPEQWTGFCFAPAVVRKDSPGRLLMLENKSFTTAEETDKLLWVIVV